MDTVLFALWFFLPAGIANSAPIVAAKVPGLKRLSAPIDHGKDYRGKRLLGDHKTWRGLVSGVVAATVIVIIQQLIIGKYDLSFLHTKPTDYLYYSPILLGVLFGIGALGGDALESLFKRRTSIPAGESWFPFDQLDYVIGGCILMLFVVRLSLYDYVAVIGTWFIMHLLFSYIGYLMRFKPKPI